MEQDRKPRNKPTQLWPINLWQGRQEYTMEKKTVSSIKWCWEKWTATYERMKLEHSLTPNTKINSKWSNDLNVKPDTIKLLKENISRTLFDINSSNIFLDLSPRVIEIKTKINKWDLIKLKSFRTAKDTINKIKRQPMDWEKISANNTTYKGLISKMYKQLIQLNIKKSKQPNQKMGRRLK